MDTITLYQNNLFVKEIGPPYRKTFSLARWINHSEGKLRPPITEGKNRAKHSSKDSHQCELEKLFLEKKTSVSKKRV